MKTAEAWEGDFATFLKKYEYQPELTVQLDGLGSQPFEQDVINEIVLWKVNRYAKLSPGALDALNSVSGIQPKSHGNARIALATLLDQTGVDLPMASTFLRFRNRAAFQIIDRHAYRAAFGEDYPLHHGSKDGAKIDLYFRYLDKLFELADSKKVDFKILDRVLYVFDKKFNGRL